MVLVEVDPNPHVVTSMEIAETDANPTIEEGHGRLPKEVEKQEDKQEEEEQEGTLQEEEQKDEYEEEEEDEHSKDLEEAEATPEYVRIR